MNFAEIKKRALEIRRKYAVLEKKTIGVEWTGSQISQGLVVDVGELMELIWKNILWTRWINWIRKLMINLSFLQQSLGMQNNYIL